MTTVANQGTKPVSALEPGEQLWSIGIYTGRSPLEVSAPDGVKNPVLTREQVTDIEALLVADPFLLKTGDTWHMFFEVLNKRSRRGEIGFATSGDGLHWKYEQMVLAEPFHLSYPYVFEWQGEFYMMPECHDTGAIRLYKAVEFPRKWAFHRILLHGQDFRDASIIQRDGHWWLFAETDPAQKCDTLRLYHANDLLGPWMEHPASPVVRGDSRIARPSGRLTLYDGKLIRYTQDCQDSYGGLVRAFEITELTPTKYSEKSAANEPILSPDGKDWNSFGMHHIDPQPLGDGRWIASVDGCCLVDTCRFKRQERPKNRLGFLKRRLKNRRWFLYLSELKWGVIESLRDIDFRIQHARVVSLHPKTPSKGSVLLSYLVDPFLLKPGQSIPNTSLDRWASAEIARIFLDLGYSVDVISYWNERFIPTKKYVAMVDMKNNIERLGRQLGPGCAKIFYGEMAHRVFHNAAESRRILELQQRRGVTLRENRYREPSRSLENADYAIIKGNEFAVSTFQYAKKPIFVVPTGTTVSFPWPEGKDWENCRNRFLWFSSGPLVHKGLDLALEAFAQMPEHHLTVCAPVQQEKEFEHAFFRELYGTPNIETLGFVDVASARFKKLLDDCVAMLHLSCAESQSGAVLNCMRAGLIPIISYESGVDVHDFGVSLRNCSVEEVKKAVRVIAGLPSRELSIRARKAWEFVCANHTKETFSSGFRKAVVTILDSHHKGK